MRKLLLSIAIVSVFVLMAVAPALALKGQPTFDPAIYADGQAWGTKGNGPLPAPNMHNVQSFDKLYQVPGQLPVSEAGPGNPMYNGGRWWTVQVEWVTDPYLLMSYDDVMAAMDAGDLVLSDPQMPAYFQCPLLPVK